MKPRGQVRNPGPSWGYRFIHACDRLLPEWLFRILRQAGSWGAVLLMTAQRRHSRDYLHAVLRRPARLTEVYRHFHAFTEFLVLRLRVAHGAHQPARFAPGADHFAAFMAEGHPTLLGSLHLGHSDLLGFLFAGKTGHRIFMVRERRGNSEDVERLLGRYRDCVSIIWANDPQNLLFVLKEAVAGGGSVAMKCDRVEFSARTESFEFLGARRQFPFTIYHLALIFDLPVLLAIGVPGAAGESVVHSSTRWERDPALDKAENLARARLHFQAFLNRVEDVLREQPYQWFNFIPFGPGR